MKPPEDTKHDLVKQWLAKADQDLGVARLLLSQGLYYGAVGYHCQQAVEKYLKAYLVERQIEFPKTHDLGLLLDLVSSIESRLGDALNEIVSLNDYAADVRYPSDIPDLSFREAETAVKLASMVKDKIGTAF